MLKKSTVSCLLIIASSIILHGCINLGSEKAPPLSTYMLSCTPPDSIKAPRTHKTLLISLPTASPGYDTACMMYVLQPFQLQSFTKNRWADLPTYMLQPLMMQSLRNTQHYHAVVSAPFVGAYDVRLDTKLLTLQQEFMQKPSQIHLKLYAQLVSTSSTKVIASHIFDIIEPAPSDNPYGGVIAANQATTKLLYQLTEFSLKYS